MPSSILNSDDGVISGTSGLKSVGGDDGNLVFQSKGTETARINTDKQIVAAAGTALLPALTTTGDVNTGIFFPAADTIAFAEGGAEAMRINSVGNVGIGTTSPGHRLDVLGSSGDIVRVQDGTNAPVLLGTNSTGPYMFTSSAADLRFGTNNAERARITSAGNFLWGATTLGGISGADAKGIDFPDGMRLFSSRASTAAREHIIFYNPNGDVGSIDTTASATAYNTSSDYRLKENIAPMQGALATVAQLKPCTFTWKVDGSASQGFIAHELAEVMPECVTGEKDAVEIYTDEEGNEQTRIKPQGVDTSFLVATLTAAIQELKAELDEAKARIAALEAVPGNE